MARTWLESIGDQCNVCFRLSDGKVLRGKLRDSLLGNKAFCIRGRTLDLDSAYKQILFKSVLVVRIQQESRSCSYPMFFHVVLQPVCMGSTDWPGPCTPLVEEFLGWFGAITTQLDVESSGEDVQMVQSAFSISWGGVFPSRRPRGNRLACNSMFWESPLILSRRQMATS